MAFERLIQIVTKLDPVGVTTGVATTNAALGGIGVATAQYGTALQSAEFATGNFAYKLQSIGGASTGFIASMGAMAKTMLPFAAATGGFMFLKKSFDEFIQGEAITTRLAKSVENAGVSYANVKGEIDAQAKSLERLTGYEDHEVMGAMQRLLLLTNDYGKSVKNLPMVLDVATAANMDLEGAARAVAFAMEGDVRGLRGLAPGLVATMKDMDILGSQTERAAYIMGVLHSRVDGAAAAMQASAAGPGHEFKNAFIDLEKAIGGKLGPTWNTVIGAMGDAFRTWATLIRGDMPHVLDALAPGDQLRDKWQAFFDWLKANRPSEGYGPAAKEIGEWGYEGPGGNAVRGGRGSAMNVTPYLSMPPWAPAYTAGYPPRTGPEFGGFSPEDIETLLRQRMGWSGVGLSPSTPMGPTFDMYAGMEGPKYNTLRDMSGLTGGAYFGPGDRSLGESESGTAMGETLRKQDAALKKFHENQRKMWEHTVSGGIQGGLEAATHGPNALAQWFGQTVKQALIRAIADAAAEAAASSTVKNAIGWLFGAAKLAAAPSTGGASMLPWG